MNPLTDKYNINFNHYKEEPLPLSIIAALEVLENVNKSQYPYRSLSNSQPVPKSLEEKSIKVLQNFISWPQRIWRALTFQSTFFSDADKETIQKLTLSKGSESSDFPSNEKDALYSFFVNAADILGKPIPVATQKEAELIKKMSARIWDSANVQEKSTEEEKYQEYTNLMAEFFRGSHFVCELNETEAQEKDSWKSLFTADPSKYIQGKKYTGTGYVGTRVSSHYVKFLGENNHYHLRGKAIPETVFADVMLAKKDGNLIFGKKAEDVLAEDKDQVAPKKFVWIQTENNPDGPDWISYLKHRTIDFVIYKFRKHILNSATPNVGHYGYGVGDLKPIVLRLNPNASTTASS